MKKCNECNCEMIEDCKIKGKHPFEHNVNERVDIKISVPTCEKGTFLGIQYDITNQFGLKARICPKCGKIELYAKLNDNRGEI